MIKVSLLPTFPLPSSAVPCHLYRPYVCLFPYNSPDYYRIPSDNRDLNYSKYNEEGEKDLSTIEDYNSHNTERLDVDGMIKLLHKLDFIADIEAGSLIVPEGV